MKLFVSYLLGLASASGALERSIRDISCADFKAACKSDFDYGFFDDIEDCLVTRPDCATSASSVCLAYNYAPLAGSQCCRDGIDVDKFWPAVRPTLQRGARPLAPGQTCPTGCRIADAIDQFVCAFNKRMEEINVAINTLSDLIDMKGPEVKEYSEQFIARIRKIKAKTVRSKKTIETIRSTFDHMLDTEVEITKKKTQISTTLDKLTQRGVQIQKDLDAWWYFCKLGKQCPKQCHFTPIEMGGIKKNCAAYYYAALRAGKSQKDLKSMSGIYEIQPSANLPVKWAYCDMRTDGGGYTMVQHHGISRDDLWEDYQNTDTKLQAVWNVGWNAYKNGFGNVACNGEADFWYGNDYLHALTHPKVNRAGGAEGGGGKQRLRIDLYKWNKTMADGTQLEGEFKHGYYNMFAVNSEQQNYRMIATKYSELASFGIGDAWKGMALDGEIRNMKYTKQTGAYFSTRDRDNDNYCRILGTKTVHGVKTPRFSRDDEAAGCDYPWKNVHEVTYSDQKELEEIRAAFTNCARQDRGGFWYNRCSAGNLNGRIYENGWYQKPYLPGNSNVPYDDGMVWASAEAVDYSFKMSEMRIRPDNFEATVKKILSGSVDAKNFEITGRNGVPLGDE